MSPCFSVKEQLTPNWWHRWSSLTQSTCTEAHWGQNTKYEKKTRNYSEKAENLAGPEKKRRITTEVCCAHDCDSRQKE